MKIIISSDHAGFELKNHLVTYLEENGIEVVDKGPKELNNDDDYPDLISLTAQEVANDLEWSRGIVIGHSGQGEAIVANKFHGIRAAVYYGGPDEILKLSREHNDANILSLGAAFLTPQQAEHAVDTWIETQFTNEERHMRRIRKIKELESKIA
jgi:ribose 5-phosphate isomerase B